MRHRIATSIHSFEVLLMPVYNLHLFIFFLHLLSTQSTCQKVAIFFVRVEQQKLKLLALSLSRLLGIKFIANSLISTSILIYQPWVALTKVMTSELVYNFRSMIARFPSALIRAPLTSKVRPACIICCNIHSTMEYQKSHIINNSSLFIVNLLGSQKA